MTDPGHLQQSTSSMSGNQTPIRATLGLAAVAVFAFGAGAWELWIVVGSVLLLVASLGVKR